MGAFDEIVNFSLREAVFGREGDYAGLYVLVIYIYFLSVTINIVSELLSSVF